MSQHSRARRPSMKMIRHGRAMIAVQEGGFYDRHRMRASLEQVKTLSGLSDLRFFERFRKQTVEIEGLGASVTPNYFYDLSAYQAIFTADHAALRELVEGPLEPLWLLPGRGIIVFTALQHRFCDIDPYLEFSVAIPVNRPGAPNLGPVAALAGLLRRENRVYIWKLPVTTELACVRGVIRANFPKYVCPLEFELTGENPHATVVSDGTPDLVMRWKPLRTRPAPAAAVLRTHALTIKDGRVLDNLGLFHPVRRASSMKADAATLELNRGPLSTALRALRLGRMLRFEAFTSAQLVIHEPVVLPGV